MRFESVVILRAKLIEKLGDQVPNTITFDVGYYEGSQHSKIWICNNDDLEAMYHKVNPGEITLWCEGALSSTEEESRSTKRNREDNDNPPSKRQKKEEEVESVLKEKHGDAFDTPRLRLWARMIVSKLHANYDSPPSIPAFTSTPKKPRQQSYSSAIEGAAIAFAKALGGSPKDAATPSQPPVGVSPGRAVELRMKNYEQLRYVQQLYDDGILCEEEYAEQKQDILGSLRKL